MRLGRIYKISCGHRLPMSGEEMLHGHNYTIEVTVEGPINSETGLVIECRDLDQCVEKIIKELDHQTLNNIMKEAPTVENVVRWLGARLWRQLNSHRLTRLRLKIWETDRIFAEEEWEVEK